MVFLYFSWSKLTVSTNSSHDDSLQSEAAGMVEGYATADHISMYYQATVGDYCEKDKTFCDQLRDFLETNEKWISDKSKEEMDSYWYQVKRVQIYFQIS